jgi:hypothetical protein
MGPYVVRHGKWEGPGGGSKFLPLYASTLLLDRVSQNKSRLNIYYVGHNKNTGSNTLFSYSMLKFFFFLYIVMEKKISTFLRYLIILHLI